MTAPSLAPRRLRLPLRALLLAAAALFGASGPSGALDVDIPAVTAESGAPSRTVLSPVAVTPVPGLSPSFSVPSLTSGVSFLAPSAVEGALARPGALPARAAAAPAASPAAALAPAAAPAPAAALAAAAAASEPGLPAPSIPSEGDRASESPAAAGKASAPAFDGEPAASRSSRVRRFAAGLARSLFSRRDDGDESAPVTGSAPSLGRTGLAPSAPVIAPRRVRAVDTAAPAIPGKRPFMAGTFVYNLATSVMLVVQQALFFSLAQADQIARGVPAAQAGLHAAGVVFALATLTGALRIPGNALGSWLSTKTDQKNLSTISAVARAAILAAVAALVVLHQITLPLAAALYGADWLIGGLEEVSRNTQTLALVKPSTREFKSWSTLSQFLAQLTGMFGPLFVIVLAQFKGLAMAGHVLAPLLFGAAAALYAMIPRDAFNRGSTAGAASPAARSVKWRAFLADRSLLLPVLALALTSVLLLKGPLSLNMASLILGKSGADLVTYSALLSGLFGAGLGVGSWLAHSQGGKSARRLTPARWLALAALATAALAASWTFGLWPALALPAIASAWFFFALANAAGQSLTTHRLQESVAAAGPDKKYVVGLSLTLSNVVITALRVLAGAIFFLAAKNWQTAFGLFGGLMLLVAAGQWWVARGLAKGAPDAA